MEQLAQLIIEDFESNLPWLTSLEDYDKKQEETMLYLSAKKIHRKTRIKQQQFNQVKNKPK